MAHFHVVVEHEDGGATIQLVDAADATKAKAAVEAVLSDPWLDSIILVTSNPEFVDEGNVAIGGTLLA